MLSVKNLNQYYGQSHILHDISFTAPEKQCTCIIGRNGVGKTTLLKSIMGQVAAKAEQLSYDGTDLLKQRAEKRPYLGIAYVPQGRQIFSQLSVEDNLRISLPVYRKRTGERSAGVPEMIYELFPVLYDMKQRRGGDLSGGQQQQLAIGRALAFGPKLLILDEPTEGIQPSIIKDIERAIRSLAETGEMAILLVEQYYDFARALADQYLVMERGEIVMRGAGADMDRDGVREALAV